MDRKFTDIFPPKEEQKKEIKIPLKKIKPKPPVSSAQKGLFFSLILIPLIGIFFYFTFSKAKIEIWPETEILTFPTRLTVDKDFPEPDFSAKVIPGEIFEREKTLSEVFQTSGKIVKEKKAEGTIQVYNNYSTFTQALVVNTRFVSTEGKVFRTPTRVVIPGGHYEKGKFIPGEIDIKVVADQVGPEYNIGPSTFSIPGFAGTDKYTKFYAKSFQSMEGGFKEEVSVVTKEDLSQAEETLTKKVKEESETLLKNELASEQIASEFLFLADSIKTEVIEKFSLATVGAELTRFDYQVRAKSQTLLFKKEDFNQFVREAILPQVPEGKKLYEKSLQIDYSGETVNLEGGKMILSLEISAKIYSDLDFAGLKNGLRGKSLMESKVFLNQEPKITKAKVEFWPFWVTKVPESPDKIELKINVDPAPNLH